MRKALSAPLFAALLTTAAEVMPAWGDDNPVMPAAILMAASTGYWEDGGTPPADATAGLPQPASAPAAPTARHGYYKLYAVRQADRTSKVYLQQLVSTDDGPQVLSTVELSDITALKGYVTDIRPENSGGIIREPGLFATIFIKRDIDGDPQAWNVTRDELGEIAIEPAPTE